ncbi:Vitamin B12 import ATP-binding protein BtuD [Ralstonia syzygii]
MTCVDLRSAQPGYDGPLLRLEDLSVRFEADHNEWIEAVRHVSFDLHAGERFALVGESGSGKTVTALSIMRLLADAHYSGRILFEGRDLLAASERQMRGLRGADVAMVFQEPMTALNPLYTIGNQIVETLELHEGLDKRAARARAIALLEHTGIAEAPRRFDAFPHQLSGGQRQRAMIAMALACSPKLLLADEPTTALDVTVRMQILQLLRELQAEYGMAVMLITHDLNMVRAFAERVGVMERGVLVESGDTATVFNAPQHPYTVRLLESRPQRDVLPLVPLAPVLLEADQLTVTYDRHRPGFAGWFRADPFIAVDQVSLQLREGETLGIVGESGSGKTTLAQTLLGLQRPKAGDLRFLGNSLLRQTRDEALRGACPYASGVPGPVRLSLAAHDRRADRRGGAGAASAARQRRGAPPSRDRGAARSRPGPHRPGALSARVLRRAASAHRHCAGADPQAPGPGAG